jgi:hypothetical protein
MTCRGETGADTSRHKEPTEMRIPRRVSGKNCRMGQQGHEIIKVEDVNERLHGSEK